MDSIPGGKQPRLGMSLALFGMFVALMVGWRYEVGGDWLNYLENFDNNYWSTLPQALKARDPGYGVLEWIAHKYDWGMFGVNLMAAIFFTFGLIQFCRYLPRPWLALVASVPYLIIVLGMGYSRQGIALGCLMAGLVALGQGRVLPFVFWGVLGAAFHKSAVIVLPMAALGAARGRLWTSVWVAVVTFTAYIVFLQDSVDVLRDGYLATQYSSSGALIRLLMNAVPAVLLLLLGKRVGLPVSQERLWFWFAVFSVVALGTFYVSPSSTAVDRVALYLLPLQLVVASYFPDVMGRRGATNQLWVTTAVVAYAAVQFVWLNFAKYSYAWIPYKFYPFEAFL